MITVRTTIRTIASRIGSASRGRLQLAASTPVLALTLIGVLARVRFEIAAADHGQAEAQLE